MSCEALARDACPCILADIGQCRCCSLLMGKEFCECDYPGVCVYEKYRWEEKQPLPNHDHIVAVFPFTTGAGLIVRSANAGSASLGTLLTFSLSSQMAISGVVLQTYPDQQLLYSFVTSRYCQLSAGERVTTIRQEHNVFGRDAVYLTDVDGQSILIFTDSDLLTSLAALENGLKDRGASVQLRALSEKRPDSSPDLFLFISRSKEELCHALKRLPWWHKSRSAFWFIA